MVGAARLELVPRFLKTSIKSTQVMILIWKPVRFP